MNNTLRYTALIILLTAYSCNNVFLNDNLTPIKIPAGESEILIAPAWGELSFQFSCPDMGNTDFEIVQKPDWLEIDTKKGKLKNSIGKIGCKAILNAQYDKIGIYFDKMEVLSAGKTFWIPVGYVTEGNPKIKVSETVLINAGVYSKSYVVIRNTGEGILFWNIERMPEWLEIDPNSVNSPTNTMIHSGGVCSLLLKVKLESLTSIPITGSIIISSNNKSSAETTIVATVNVGNPTILLNDQSLIIDFGKIETAKSISFQNRGDGFLIWSLENLPTWLNVPQKSGILDAFGYKNLSLVCYRDLLPEGQSEAKITLKSNDSKNPSQIITIRARSSNNSANVKAVEGQITDAFYDKAADILYYVTTKPDKLIAYNTKTKAIAHEVSLGKAPTCFSISEDGKNALVGQGGMISKVDLQNFTILKTYSVTGILSDIEFAANNCCAYTEAGNYSVQWTKIYRVDLSNGSISNGTTVYEDCRIKKVPGKDYIIGSETRVSSGLYVYDSNTRTEKAKIFSSIDKFWFVNDGENLVSKLGNVFRVSDPLSLSNYNSNGLSPIAKLQYSNSSSSYGLEFVEYSKSSKSLFCLVKSDYSTGTFPQVYQLDDNNYALMKSYSYDDYYRVNNIDYQVQAKYVFANVAGNELIVIRNATSINAWSFEFIAVTK